MSGATCQRVTCPYCHAAPGRSCATASGKTLDATNQHDRRWTALSEAYHTRRFRVELIADDPGLGLMAGDVLICQRNALDPAKFTVVRRERDGFSLWCNQYRADVRFIEFVEEVAS